MIDTCDLHDACRGQGCEFDPKDCPRVRDLRAGIDKRAGMDDAFDALDDAGKFAKLQRQMRDRPSDPVPAAWVVWLMQYVRPPRSGPGVIVVTNPEKPSGWVRSQFEKADK